MYCKETYQIIETFVAFKDRLNFGNQMYTALILSSGTAFILFWAIRENIISLSINGFRINS